MQLHEKSKVPLYVELYDQFKRMIHEGKYVENQKLPSKRKLAASLKISPLTVDAAYQQLIAEGYVYSVEKSGYFVGKRVELLKKKTSQTFHQDMDFKEESIHYTYELKTNVVDTTLFPNATWAKLAREVLSENHHEMLNHLDPQGLQRLRREIARYLELYRGMKVHERQIIIGSGSTSLIGMLVELLGRHKKYAIEDPGYSKIFHLFKGNDVDLSLIPLDDFGCSIDTLRKQKIDVIHITPSHQFPMGIVMPIQRRNELLNWVSETTSRYIIEDDYDSEFRYQGKPIPALQGLDIHDRVIYMNTFTKTLAPSFRMSYMVLPEHLLPLYQLMSSYHGCTVPNFEQFILFKFMHEGYFERHVNRMRNHYREKIDRIIRLTSSYPKVSIEGYEAGLHFLIKLPPYLDETSIVNQIRSEKILVSGLKSYVQDLEGYHHGPALVIGYSGLSSDDLEQAIQWILKIISKNIV
jgi:GntR family transcriptional regulator/MocR family aminotransferase